MLFLPKNGNFLSAKLRGHGYEKVYFLKLHICVYLRIKFQVSSIILTSFREGVILKTETLKCPPTLGLIFLC